jgi:hypothetical protein
MLLPCGCSCSHSMRCEHPQPPSKKGSPDKTADTKPMIPALQPKGMQQQDMEQRRLSCGVAGSSGARLNTN